MHWLSIGATFDDLEVHCEGDFSVGCHFHVHFSNPSHAFASHGLPAIAELLVLVPCSDGSISVFIVRRSALHGLCDSNFVRPSVRPSVRLSVCHTRGLCPHGSTYDHDFFTIW